MAYSIIKAPRYGYLIDDGSGTSIRYRTRRDAELTIEKWLKAEGYAKEINAERYAARLRAVQTYLAVRAWRRAAREAQLTFNF